MHDPTFQRKSRRALLKCAAVAFVVAAIAACAQRPATQEPTTAPAADQEAPVMLPAGALTEAQLLQHPIRYYLDLPYAGNDNPRQRLDVYVPEQPSYVPMPVVIYLHGGMWQSGDKAQAAERMLGLVTSGDFAVVAMNYRLTDEAQWPAQLHDVKAAIRWVRAQSNRYGFDPQRIALWGHEAGGQLALASAMTNQAQDMAGNLGAYTHIRSDVAAVVNYSGITDLNALLSHAGSIDRASSTAPEALLIGGLLRENSDIASAASPIHYVRRQAPPVMSVYANRDQVVPEAQGRVLHQRLEEVGTEHYLVQLTTAEGNTPNAVTTDSPWAQADQRALAFLQRVLLGHLVTVETQSIE